MCLKRNPSSGAANAESDGATTNVCSRERRGKLNRRRSEKPPAAVHAILAQPVSVALAALGQRNDALGYQLGCRVGAVDKVQLSERSLEGVRKHLDVLWRERAALEQPIDWHGPTPHDHLRLCRSMATPWSSRRIADRSTTFALLCIVNATVGSATASTGATAYTRARSCLLLCRKQSARSGVTPTGE